MTQRSLFWDTEALGDGGPYTQADLHDRFLRCILNGTGNRGVVRGWRDDLLVSGTSSPVSVAAGGAVVYGLLHDSDAAVSVSIPTPSAGHSRYDRVVLRRDWAAQTIRVARVAGVAGVIPAVPALTQTAGAVYEVPLATVLVSDAGAVTLTDAREYCACPTLWPANIVTAGMFEEAAVTTAARPDRARWDTRGGGQFRSDANAFCLWTAGGPYDYWEFAGGDDCAGWGDFLGGPGIVGSTVDFYVWSVPDTNGAGGGAENCQWSYSIYTATGPGTPVNTAGTTDVDQQARVNTRAYRDLLVSGVTVGDGHLAAVRLGRNGTMDTYAGDIRFLALEMYWTADS